MKPVWTIAFGLLCAMTSPASSATANVVPMCPVPAGAVSVSIPTGLPPALRDALREQLGEIVLPGEDFDISDIIGSGPLRHRRFIFVWNIGKRWLVATEQGGLYNDPIFIYALSDDGKTASLIESRIALPPIVCSTATKLVGSSN